MQIICLSRLLFMCFYPQKASLWEKDTHYVYWLKTTNILVLVVLLFLAYEAHWVCVWYRCYPSWLWELEWMTSSFSLMLSVRPDRTRGSHLRWGECPHLPILLHPVPTCLLSYLLRRGMCESLSLPVMKHQTTHVPHIQPGYLSNAAY